ncbi:hypothetical protein FB45DRAFT_742856, partial [Roridomyces roridus]
TAGRTRPEREPGLVASNASFIVPDAIRKKFSSGGWSTHVPLDYLTDKFCGITNAGATKALNDLWTTDGSSGSIVSVAKELPVEGELKLTFDEWFQAWQRLLQLIAEFVPHEYGLWKIHYESILLHPMRAQQWPLCLAYDSRVRRLATTSKIDPSQFQLAIWNELEPAFIANNAAQLLRAEMSINGFSNSHSFRSAPDTSNPNFLAIMPSNTRCFVCGSTDRGHSARICQATTLVNGSDIILRAPGRRDEEGNAYCFSFNGRGGCNRANCDQGKHWCSLCGQRNRTHNAQTCPRV